jgi:hypothetical protein
MILRCISIVNRRRFEAISDWRACPPQQANETGSLSATDSRRHHRTEHEVDIGDTCGGGGLRPIKHRQ